MRRILMLIALAALAVGCSKNKVKDVDKPAKLVSFPATLRTSHLWSASVGGTSVPLRLGLDVAVDDGRVFAAGHGGEVAAFDLKSGRVIWKARTKLPLAGGPGVATDLIAVGGTNGEVIALGAASGEVHWRVNVGSEVIAAPAVGANVIVVRAVDGRLHALAKSDGHELWQLQQTVPRLSLRGTSQPRLVGDLAICGYDNGRVVAANMGDGTSAWENLVSPPQGRSEIERLNDIDSTPQIAGNDVYVVGFQGKIAMLALDTGQIWWSHDLSSYRGMGIDDDQLYVSTGEGEVIALSRRNGSEVWRQKALAHRGLSGPVVSGDAVVVADYKGYVHWLDRKTGALAARASTSKNRITNQPVAAGDEVLVIDDRGHLNAFRSRPLK